MPSLIGVESYHRVFEEPCPLRRGRIAGALFADYDAGALTRSEAQTARSLFRAIVRDPEQETRRTFAGMVAMSRRFPPELALIVAADVEAVAARFIQASPVLGIEVLVDIVGSGQEWRQVAVARRAVVEAPVAAALAEVGVEPACVALLENEAAEIPLSGYFRLQTRFADDRASAGLDNDTGRVARALLNRQSVPATVVEAQILATSDRLLNFVESTGWMGSRSARAAVANAVEHGLIDFAARRQPEHTAALVRRWAQAGRVTPMLILRAAAYGEFAIFLHGLAHIARMPAQRVWVLASDPGPYGLRGLCIRAGLPRGAGAFVTATRTLSACHRFGPRRDFVLRGLIAGQANFGAELAALPMRFAREAGVGKFAKEAILMSFDGQKNRQAAVADRRAPAVSRRAA